MKYYERKILKREAINRFGKLGFVEHTEFVKTNSVDQFNKGKRIPFVESLEAKKYLLHLETNKVYCK